MYNVMGYETAINYDGMLEFNKLELLENKTILENQIIALCDNLRDGCLIIEQSKQYIIQLNDLYFRLNNINIELEA